MTKHLIISKLKERSGFTLVELLVYIGLASLVVMIAGNAYVDSMRFKASTDRKLATYSGTNEVLQAAEYEMLKMGVKGQKLMDSATVTNRAVYIDTTVGSPDFSSFVHTNNDSIDAITYRNAVFNDSGRIVGVEQITWQVISKSLWRYRVILPDSARDTLRIADNIEVFNIDLGLYKGDSANTLKVFKDPDSIAFAPVSGTTLIPFDSSNGTGFRTFSATIPGEAYLATAYASGSTPLTYTMAPGMTYGVEISMGFNARIRDNFVIDSNFMALSLRKAVGTSLTNVKGLTDYLIYPGGDYNVNTRTYIVTHGETSTFNAVPVLRFQLQAATGAMDARAYITQVRIWEISRESYDWRSNIPTASIPLKARVKALRLTVRIQNADESSTVIRVIPTPNNGV